MNSKILITFSSC